MHIYIHRERERDREVNKHFKRSASGKYLYIYAIYCKLLGQYGGHQRKQILESAIYLKENSKIPILNKNWM